MKSLCISIAVSVFLLCLAGCDSEKSEKTVANNQPVSKATTPNESDTENSLKIALENIIRQCAAEKSDKTEAENKILVDEAMTQMLAAFPNIYKVTPKEKDIIDTNNKKELIAKIQESYDFLDKHETVYSEILKYCREKYHDENFSIHELFILNRILSFLTESLQAALSNN